MSTEAARRTERRGIVRSTAAAVLLGGLLALPLLQVFAGTAPASAADNDSSVGIEVTTSEGTSGTGGTGSSGTATGGGSGSISTGTSRSATGSVTSGTTVSTPDGETQGAGAAQPPKDEAGISGVLYMSGLTTRSIASLNPFDGDLEVSFTVRNASQEKIDAKAEIWIEGPFGNGIGERATVDIAGIGPGEIRTVRALLGGVGQWGYVTAHATLIPPADVAGIELTSFTREAGTIAFPWFSALTLLSAGVAVVVVRLIMWASRPAAVVPA